MVTVLHARHRKAKRRNLNEKQKMEPKKIRNRMSPNTPPLPDEPLPEPQQEEVPETAQEMPEASRLFEAMSIVMLEMNERTCGPTHIIYPTTFSRFFELVLEVTIHKQFLRTVKTAIKQLLAK